MLSPAEFDWTMRTCAPAAIADTRKATTVQTIRRKRAAAIMNASLVEKWG
jgi:hypothetical protein